jgi:2-polyprenyl-6-methoxyphenol hydroxylase-like FAD-dependent oxidoreductase
MEGDERNGTMSEQNMHVVIIGGGIGGLCLAQGLKRAGVRVAVYERDESPSSRLQGFRVHIDPQGSTALHECLPEHLWEIFDGTGGHFAEGFTLLTEQLQELLSFRERGERSEGGERSSRPIARHRSVSRNTLRLILLAGLEDAVHFDKRFVRYEERADGKIIAHFAGGSTAEGDVLVAADGVNSPVRGQYLPHAQPVDTGVVTFGGKIPLTDGVLAMLPSRMLDGPVILVPQDACSLFMAAWKRESVGEERLRKLGIRSDIPQESDYVILGFGVRGEYLALDGGIDGDPVSTSGAVLKDTLRRKVARWHPTVRKLVELLDENEMSPNRIRSSEPVVAWPTTRVTLLGDAIHSMTPYRGIGANIALKDAALLCSKLAAADRGERPLLAAIAEYEVAMREYGFAAVAASLKSMQQATGEKRFGFGLAKTAMRVVNAMPLLRRKLSVA